MSTSPDLFRFFPHNTVWRRLRRRFFVDRFTLFGVALACPPALCSVVWLLHGPLWLTICLGALWISSSLFMTTTLAIGLVFKAGRDDHKSRSGSIRPAIVWHLSVNVATVIVLLMGRVDRERRMV